MYFASISLANSFWIGKWDDIKDDAYSVQVAWTPDGQTAAGDCVVASKDHDYNWTRTDCSSDAAYFCEAREPKCPPQYIWIPNAGLDSCYKLLPNVGYEQNGKMEQSISTVNKACMSEGTSLAAPDSDIKLGALATWLAFSDRMLHGDWQDKGASPRLFLGYRFFKQSITKNGICSDCAWDDYYYSPWVKQYADADVPTMISGVSPSEDKSCYFIQRNPTSPYVTIDSIECYKSETYDEDTFLGAVCEYRECKISLTETCIFPFKFAGRTYDKCTTAGFGEEARPAWCSLQVDEAGVHVEGSEGLCPAECPVSDCPLGFWSHLGTCIQESASTPADAPQTVADSETICLEQGARLYQPRSTRSLRGLTMKTPQFFSAGNTAVDGILDWADPMHTAIGMTSDDAFKLFYKDGSAVPHGLTKDPLGLRWSSGNGFPSGAGTCVNWYVKDEIANMACDGYSTDSAAYLAYVCEARPMTTVDTFKHCHFPFKESADGPLRHSCLYSVNDKGKPYGWCATKVDADGVMVDGEIGICDDERNTVYSGPGINYKNAICCYDYSILSMADADNTCKLPFFHDGIWYENCTLSPQSQYWCPTKIHAASREQDGANSWGYCPDHLVPDIDLCGENYDVVSDLCVRISPYPLSWNDAEAKCQDEGGHLLHILSQEVQTGVQELIQKKKQLKDFFEDDKWSTGLSSSNEKYWIGGMVM